MPTLVCVPIMVDDFEEAASDARLARDLGADLVEYRLDRAFEGLDDEHAIRSIETLIARSPLPCIATCRPTWEGGEYDGDDDERISLYERLGLAETPPGYVDIELAALTRSANLRQKVRLAVDHARQRKDLSTSLVLSVHDFEGRPADLSRKLIALQEEDAARVIKVAYRARTIRDNLELLELPHETQRPTIALGMGEFGLMSRVLAPKFGGFLTFAALVGGKGTAPGQPTIAELNELYRFRSIAPSTKVYGVVGWPVGHSLSPMVHNAGFEARGHDGVYLPMPIPTAETTAGDDELSSAAAFKATLLELIDHPTLDLAGLSVTLPHKQRLVALARAQGWSSDKISQMSGSANTVAIDRSGGGIAVSVTNTDSLAAVECLRDQIGAIAGKRIAIIGAGGVARAIAFGLAAEGASLVIANRTIDNARALAEAINALGPVAATPRELDQLDGSSLDAIVNATPVGMQGGPDPDGLPIAAPVLDSLRAGTAVFETVYSPLETPLVRASRERKLAVIDGATMFVRQAAEQFQRWTGARPPIGLFDRIVRERLEQSASD